jgi:hypothetical protein
MVCFVNAFAKLSTAKSASFDDIRKRNLYYFRDKEGFADKLSAECDQQLYYKELLNEKCATLVI